MRTVAPAAVRPWILAGVAAGSIAGLTWTDSIYLALVWACYLVVGFLVVRRQPHHRLGWLMLATGSASVLAMGVSLMAVPPAEGPAVFESLLGALAVWPWLVVCAVVALFPEGHAAGTYDRALLRVILWGGCLISLLMLITPGDLDSGRPNPLAPSALDWGGQVAGAGFLIVPLLLMAALLGVGRKWVRTDGIVHSQYSCLLFGAAVTAASFLLAFGFDGSLIASLGWLLSLAALPLSIGVAILRFHLYEIDRIFRRTTTYAVVTGLVATVYVGILTVGTWALPGSSDLAVAAGTLAAAALVRPLLSRVQRAVDRRFNRERYDTERIIDTFGHHLRGTVAIDDVQTLLRGAVQRTLEPAFSRVELVDGSWLPPRC